jgi:hypothetical protein
MFSGGRVTLFLSGFDRGAKGGFMCGKELRVEDVKLARRLVRAGEPLKELAVRLEFPYSVLRRAVRGETWHTIKDPPALAKDELRQRRRKVVRLEMLASCNGAVGEVRQPCYRCEILTSRPSGLCDYCERGE